MLKKEMYTINSTMLDTYICERKDIAVKLTKSILDVLKCPSKPVWPTYSKNVIYMDNETKNNGVAFKPSDEVFVELA